MLEQSDNHFLCRFAKCLNKKLNKFLDEPKTKFHVARTKNINRFIFFYFYFYLYIYPSDSQESDGGAIHRVSNYPDLLPEMQNIAVR